MAVCIMKREHKRIFLTQANQIGYAYLIFSSPNLIFSSPKNYLNKERQFYLQ